MRILFFGNNWIAWKIVSWLKEINEEIVGLVLHPEDKQKFRDEIIESSGVEIPYIFNGQDLRKSKTIEGIRCLRPDFGISAFFGYILEPKVIDLMPSGCINIHPSLLPYNRGAYPNVWSIVDRTPSGVTLHHIDAGIDTGDVIAQKQVKAEPVDTGESLYHKLECACVALFKETWPAICSGQAPRCSQKDEIATSHLTKDVEKIDCIDLDRSYNARDLIDLIRARTFPPYQGAYFVNQGRKIYLRLQLEYGEEI